MVWFRISVMTAFVLLAALSVGGAFAQDEVELYYQDIPTSDVDLQYSCQKWIAPQEEPEDTYGAKLCARTAQEFLISSGRYVYDDHPTTSDAAVGSMMECAVQIVLNNANGQQAIGKLLAAEFDKTCAVATP